MTTPHPIQAEDTMTGAAVELARNFVKRSQAQGYRGIARDRLALDWFLGAATMLRLRGQPDQAAYLERLAALLLTTRGYSWLVNFAAMPENTKSEETAR